MQSMPDCRAIWASLESGRPISLDDLQMIAAVQPEDSIGYLSLLMRNGYVAMSGMRRAASGEALPVFKLVKRTGPEAPYQDANGKLVDPNVTIRAAGPRGLFKAEVRLAAERLGGPFTPSTLRALIRGPGLRPKQFDSIWAQLKRSGELVRDETAYPDGTQCWIYRPHPGATELRKFFKARAGEAVDSNGLKSALGPRLNGGTIRHALNLLIAEGYRVDVSPFKNGVVVYQVDRGRFSHDAC